MASELHLLHALSWNDKCTVVIRTATSERAPYRRSDSQSARAVGYSRSRGPLMNSTAAFEFSMVLRCNSCRSTILCERVFSLCIQMYVCYDRVASSFPTSKERHHILCGVLNCCLQLAATMMDICMLQNYSFPDTLTQV